MKKYIYIQCFERDIFTPEVYDTQSEAHSAMHKDFLEAVGDGEVEYMLENEGIDLKNMVGYYGDDYELGTYVAWANGRQGNWDARICEIEV